MWASHFVRDGNKLSISSWLATEVQVCRNVGRPNPRRPNLVYIISMLSLLSQATREFLSTITKCYHIRHKNVLHLLLVLRNAGTKKKELRKCHDLSVRRICLYTYFLYLRVSLRMSWSFVYFCFPCLFRISLYTYFFTYVMTLIIFLVDCLEYLISCNSQEFQFQHSIYFSFRDISCQKALPPGLAGSLF